MSVRTLMVFLLAGLGLVNPAGAADTLRAFPAPDSGMVRYVIELPPRSQEDNWRVELQVGKTVEVMPANHYFFAGQLESETIEGWGYNRYILRQLGPMAGTLMAPLPGARPEKRFVTLGGEPALLRYNSRLPLVVYVPDGVNVRYRLWRAEKRTGFAVAH